MSSHGAPMLEEPGVLGVFAAFTVTRTASERDPTEIRPDEVPTFSGTTRTRFSSTRT